MIPAPHQFALHGPHQLLSFIMSVPDGIAQDLGGNYMRRPDGKWYTEADEFAISLPLHIVEMLDAWILATIRA